MEQNPELNIGVNSWTSFSNYKSNLMPCANGKFVV